MPAFMDGVQIKSNRDSIVIVLNARLDAEAAS
jgi:hypothetical protein